MGIDHAEHIKIAWYIPGAMAEQGRAVIYTLQQGKRLQHPHAERTLSSHVSCTFCAALGGGACGGSAYRGVRVCSQVVLAVGLVQGACV